jgi:hypothetical protein
MGCDAMQVRHFLLLASIPKFLDFTGFGAVLDEGFGLLMLSSSLLFLHFFLPELSIVIALCVA